MTFAKRITSLKVKFVFANRMPPKTGTPIELIPLTKLSVNSRRDCTGKSEQAVLTNRLANHQTCTEYDLSSTEYGLNVNV